MITWLIITYEYLLIYLNYLSIAYIPLICQYFSQEEQHESK
jgi:hypothetical protein